MPQSSERIKPSLGYVSGNVRVVAWALNCAMGDWGLGPALRIIKAVMQTLEMQ